MALQKTPTTPAPAHVFAHVPSPVTPTVNPPAGKGLKQPSASSRAFWIGLGVSIAWVGTVLGVIAKAGPTHDIVGIPLADLAMGVSAAVSPVAMVWMITAYLQRAADIQTIADPLRRQLTLITGESGAADARIRRFNQAIREQIELLRSAQTMSRDDLESIMDRVRQHRGELERFENISTHQVKEVQDVIRRSMLQVEQMMDDKFTMLRFLDGKLQQNGDGISRQIESVRDQAAKLLEEVEQTSSHMAEALDRAQRDSKKLADTSRLQESSLTNAAEAAADALGGLTSKIDLSVARFLERASTAREEAERLAGALDAQTRALDDLSSSLPARVSEAETVLRGVADRLYASEQLARDQAVNLSDKLSHQVDGLQQFMERFTARMTEIDSGLDRRQTDLGQLAERVRSTTGGFVESWEKSLNDLDNRAGNSLLRFTVVNDETRRNAETVAAQLADTTGKYEDVVTRMRAMSEAGGSQMKGMTEEITRQLAQFESLSKASACAGEEVQERANAALQNLQHVLERVLTAREATQAVGETLAKDIYAAVDQNEKMIARLGETAQLGARAVSAATESLGRQESELAGKARASEVVLVESAHKLQQQAEYAVGALREQTAALTNLLSETQGHLVSTDHKLQSFASTAVAPVQKAVQQIDAGAEQGLRALTHYGDGLGQQVARLQEFNARVGGMSEDMGKTTAEAVGSFEHLFTRFSAVRTAQEESVRATLVQFTDLSARMETEVVGLDSQAARAVEALQQAALKVGEQSYQMFEKAETSGTKIKDITSALQIEAAQIQNILHQQTEAINGDLTRAELKFSTLGETIRERAEAAYALIDRATSHYGDVAENTFAQAEQKFAAVSEIVRERTENATLLLDRTAAHYNAVSQTTSQDLDSRAQKIDQTVTYAQSKVEQLQAVLAQQAEQIGSGASKIETHASDIAASSGRAVQNLSVLNDKMAVTHDAAQTYSQQTLAKIHEYTGQFERQTQSMIDAAETVTGAVYKASAAFGEETSKLIDGGYQVDGILRQLTSATTALADQAAQIRAGMEQQNARLLAQLADSVAQMDVTGGKLQQLVTVATQGADQASTRFSDMTATASQRINGATQELYTVAERTETTLAALGANVTQQAASLSMVAEQIGEQQTILASANESQRAQMVDLFEKLRGAHTQASEVAERSIAHLSGSLQEIYRQMGVVGDKSQEAVGVVKLASVGFSDQATLLLQNAQAAEQQARSVLTVTSALQDQARNLREALQGESERAGETLSVLLNRLMIGGSEIREFGSSTSAVFVGLQRAIGEQTNELGTSMQQISDRQKSLTSALDAQRETINGLLGRLTLAQDETASTADRVAARLTEGAQQISQSAETIEVRSQSALANVQAATAGFVHEAETLETQARRAELQTHSIFDAALGLQDHIRNLRTAIQTDGESAREAISNLAASVANGGEEMRNAGSNAEVTLTSLHRVMSDKAEALGQSMHYIDERQQKLIASLEQQRDVVNGVLNRLALAQDETADIAERTTARLSDSADKVTKQLDAMGMQAVATLANVETAVAGFVDQASVLGIQGQQAEQQMRGLLSVTAGMQEQAHHLREAMQVESARVIEQLSSVISQLDATGQSLKAETNTATQVLDLATQHFSSTTETGGEMMRKQSELLAQVADQSEARLMGASEKMRGHLRLVGDMGDQVEQKASVMADAAEFATTRLVALRETMSTTDKEGQNIVAAASQRIDGIKAALQDELNRLSDISRQTVEQVGVATQGLAAQSDALRANVAASESALNEAASLVREESSHLPVVLGRSVSEIESATRAIKEQTSQADQALIGTADRFISVTAAARNNMVDEMQRVSGIADDAGRMLGRFGQMLAEQVASMQQGASMLSGEQKDLVDKASASLEALASVSDRLGVLRGEASETAERLVREFDKLDQRSIASCDRLAQTGEGVAKQVENLGEAATRAETQMSSASDSFRDQFERIRTGLQTQIDDINRGLMQITAQLERTGSTLRSTAVGAVAEVERVGQRFDQTSGDAAAQIDARTQRMQVATEEVSALLSGLDNQMETMLTRMASAGEGIKRQEGDALAQLQSMLTHLGLVAEKLESTRQMSGNISQHAIERLDEVVNAVQSHMNNMAAGAQTSAGVMRGINQIYSDQTQSLTKGVGDAHSQVLTMNKSIDEMQQRTDRMRSSLKLQGDELMNSLRQILAQLEMTGDGLTEAVDRTLQQQAAENLKKMG